MTISTDELRMVDPVLTTIAQGYSNNAMVAEYLFPAVTVAKLAGKVPKFGKDAFLIHETDRAVGAQSNRRSPSSIEFIEFETQEHDIETAVDYIEEEEAETYYKYEQHMTKELCDILMLGQEKEAAELVQDPDNYDVDLKTAILSAAAWNDYTLTDVDPIAVIRTGMAAVRARIGRYPNTMIIGDDTWQSLKNHPTVIEKVKYSGVTKITTDIIAELLEIPSIHVGLSVYSVDGEAMSDVWADNVILAYVDKNEKANRSEFNPSFAYTFRRKGKPEVDTYYENGGKIKVIRNTDNYCLKITSSDAAYLISDTNH